MRWIVYFILAYVAIGLQAGLAPFLTWNGASPNFVLLAVINLLEQWANKFVKG